MSHNVPFKSEEKPFNPGSAPIEFFDFVNVVGPKGGRVVIDKLIVVIRGTLTVATALWNGVDVWRAAQIIDVQDRANKSRWILSGLKSRIASIMFNGIENHQEHGNVAIGASQAIDLRMVIPFRKPKLRRPNDYSLPADIFKKCIVTPAALANAQTGTTVLSAAALTCYILAEWHEENYIEMKVEDIVRSVDFTSQVQAKLSLGGVVHDLALLKEGTTAGGDSISAITDVRCEDLGTPLLTRQDLLHSYRVKRQLGASGPVTPATERYLDPFIAGFALPFIVADETTSPWEGRVVDAMKLDVGTGVASSSVIWREVQDKSQANYNAVSARWGIAPNQWAQTGEDNSPKSMAAFSDRQRLVGSWRAPLKKAA